MYVTIVLNEIIIITIIIIIIVHFPVYIFLH